MNESRLRSGIASSTPVTEAKAERVAFVMPRKMRFSADRPTSVDLYAREIARESRHGECITVFAEQVGSPFADVRVRFWERGASEKSLARMIARSNPRIAIVNQHLRSAVAIADRLKGVPVVLVRHNFIKPPRTALSAFWRRRQFRRLAALAFVSDACRTAFRRDWPDIPLPLFTTPNGIDTNAWRPAAAKLRRIVLTGRLCPEKGVLEAVRALGPVLRRHADWHAVLILATESEGDDYSRSVRRAVADSEGRITILENLPHDEVRSIIASTTIAIAPTQGAEPFGRVAIEALASGAALIATRRGGFVEIVGDAAILIDPPSAENIAAALQSLIADPEYRARLASLGPSRVAGRYDLASAAAAFDSMIDALILKGPR